jgi:hypothetical protein
MRCLPLHMAVRLTPAVDSVQVWTCYSCNAIVESVWSEVVFVRCVTKMDWEKFEQRCAIKFCVKLGESATVTYEKVQRAYGEHSLSRAQVLFRRPRTSGRREDLQPQKRTTMWKEWGLLWGQIVDFIGKSLKDSGKGWHVCDQALHALGCCTTTPHVTRQSP